MTYKVKNWSSYQSYKDRRPTWLRLHVSLIDNYEFAMLSDAAKATLVLLWIIASEHQDPKSGIINFTNEQLSFRLRKPVTEIIQICNELVTASFINELQICNDSVTPEKRREETEERRDREYTPPAIFKNGVKNGNQKTTGGDEGIRIAEKILGRALEA